MSITTITLLARKGGVGRTSLTMHLAGQFTLEGARVLCIDLDGQASLSRAFLGSTAIQKMHSVRTTAAIFSPYDIRPERLIHETRFDNLFLAPAGNGLERYAVPREVNDSIDPCALRDFIAEVADRFDVVLIDTPPNTAVTTTWAALIATDYVVSPVPADAFGTQSIASLGAVVDDAACINPDIRILGYVLNMLQRTSINNTYARALRQLHGNQVFATEIPLAVAFREAIIKRTPVACLKPDSKPAKLIEQLAAEIQDRIRTITERPQHKLLRLDAATPLASGVSPHFKDALTHRLRSARETPLR